MSLHGELERRFAAFKGAEAALMFQRGFTSNAGTVAAILTKEDVIVSDQLNHASIIDGARLSRAEIKVFPHKDVEAADAGAPRRAKDGTRPAAHHRRRLLDGRRHRAAARSGRGRRSLRRDHDGRRRARLRRARARRQGHGRALRHRPGARRHPGRDAVEGDRRAGRVHRRAAAPDRLAGQPRPAVPVLDVGAAGGGRGVHRRARRDRGRARAHRPAVGEHAASSRRACTRWGSTPA